METPLRLLQVIRMEDVGLVLRSPRGRAIITYAAGSGELFGLRSDQRKRLLAALPANWQRHAK